MEFFTVHAGTFQSNDIGTDATERSHRATRIKMGETFYPSIRRLAVVRPFGVSSAASLPQTFSDWADFLPCNVVDRIDENNVEVDIFLSFSQTYEASPNTLSSINTIIDKFNAESTENEISWSKCFRNIFAIEANILDDDDLYLPNQARRNMMWVNGPNRQFSAAMRSITGGDFGKYDAMFLMEGDCVPVKEYWMDSLRKEAERSFLEHGPFAILGSKYNGDSWDKFRDSLPLSLQHHINGNAVYNVTHPLFLNLLDQLESESDTPYNAVPYDYRISQILIEGMLGIPPEVPPKIIKEYLADKGRELPINTRKFHKWWEMYCGHDQNPIRESRVIANYAGTNLSPRHLVNETASIIHGANLYLPWDKSKHEITLVIPDWQEELSGDLISQIDSSTHPFSNIVVMVPDSISESLLHVDTSLHVSIERRSRPDYMDLCTAPIDTEWFMIINSYHIVAPYVELLFTDDKQRRPVIPFTPADDYHCANFRRCYEIHESSKQFSPENSMIIQDFDMLFRTEERDAFCSEWVQRYGEEGDRVHTTGVSTPKEKPLGPTATSYVSYLLMMGLADNLYLFSDSTIFGARDNFLREYSEEEEMAAAFGIPVLSGRLLRDDEVGDTASSEVKKSSRRIQYGYFAPSLMGNIGNDDIYARVPTPSPQIEPAPSSGAIPGYYGDDDIHASPQIEPASSSGAIPDYYFVSPTQSPHQKVNGVNNFPTQGDYDEADENIPPSKRDKYTPITPFDPISPVDTEILEDITSLGELQFSSCCWVFLISLLTSLMIV
uniref:Uncharacterized protein n=1 Tax=Ditylum brightwellii TaxID=49249 RepID=A0A7S4VS88_9STRA